MRDLGPELKCALELISLSRIGQEVLRSFKPLLESGEIQVRDLREGASELLPEGSGIDGKPAGGFHYNGSSKVVYVDLTLDPKLIAPLLFHEIVHATDAEYLAGFGEEEKLWSVFRTRARQLMVDAGSRTAVHPTEALVEDLAPSERAELAALWQAGDRFRQERLFRTERKAYSLLYLWVEQACAAQPGYSDYLARQAKLGYVLDRPITDEEIIQGYRLNPEYVRPDKPAAA